MADRISVNIVDKSGFTSGTTITRGATVGRTPKGTEEPMFFERGAETDILNRLGYPSVDYPDIWEIIRFNTEYSMWVSAPSTGGEKAGIIYTTTGALPLTVGIVDESLFSFDNVPYKEVLGTGDGALTNFTLVTDQAYKDNSLSEIYIDGTGIGDIVVTDAEPEVISGTGIDSGTVTRATDTIDVTFSTAPAEGEIIEVEYAVDLSATAYFMLLERSPHEEIVKTFTKYNTTTGFFEIGYYIQNKRSSDVNINNYIVSQIPGTIDGQKQNIYVDDFFEDNKYLIGISNDLSYTAFTDDTSLATLGGGVRGTIDTSTELTAGWGKFSSAYKKYDAQIYFDCTADSAIPPIFDTMRNSKDGNYRDYIIPLPDNEDKATVIATKQGFGINNRGLAFYWNWRKVKESYTNTTFWTSQMGDVALKWAQMNDVFNGLAPAMIDENGHGGQLGGQILDMRYDPSEETTIELANNGINAIVFDPDYGPIITNQRTAQSPAVLSDTTFIGHSRVIDYIIKNVVRQVLIFNLVKLNDLIHRTQVLRKTESIVNPISAINIIDEYLAVCDDTNNTPEVLARREFILDLGIRVTPFSEYIKFNLILSPQGVNIADVI